LFNIIEQKDEHGFLLTIFLSLPLEEVGLRGFGGVLLLSVLGPFDGQDQVVVTVSVHRVDCALSVVAVVEVDEREAT
jgi:hypothetical protein